MTNRQYTHSHRATPLVAPEQLAELAAAVRGPAPDGDHWIGRTVAAWMSATLGRPISVYLGCTSLARLGGTRRRPRPRHVQADPHEQEACKKRSVRSSRPWPPPSRRPASNAGRSTNIGLD